MKLNVIENALVCYMLSEKITCFVDEMDNKYIIIDFVIMPERIFLVLFLVFYCGGIICDFSEKYYYNLLKQYNTHLYFINHVKSESFQIDKKKILFGHIFNKYRNIEKDILYKEIKETIQNPIR